jgi:hypothetical protein
MSDRLALHDKVQMEYPIQHFFTNSKLHFGIYDMYIISEKEILVL